MRGPSGPERGKYPSRILPEFLKFFLLLNRTGRDVTQGITLPFGKGML
jgi:hypothetical protein